MFYILSAAVIAKQLSNINDQLADMAQQQRQRFFRMPAPFIEMNEKSFGTKTREEIDSFLLEIQSKSIDLQRIIFSAEQTTQVYDSKKDNYFTIQEMRKWTLVRNEHGPSLEYLDKWGMSHKESTTIISLAYVEVDSETIALYISLKGEDTQDTYITQYLIKPYHYEVFRLIEFTKTKEEERKELLLIARVFGYPLLAVIILFIVLWIVASCQST